jgi:hypothetical protein
VRVLHNNPFAALVSQSLHQLLRNTLAQLRLIASLHIYIRTSSLVNCQTKIVLSLEAVRIISGF